MHDALVCDRRFRIFNVVDNFIQAIVVEVVLLLTEYSFVHVNHVLFNNLLNICLIDL